MTSLLDETPEHTLGFPLGLTFKICLYHLMPPITGLIVYIILIVSDSALVYCHIIEENPRWAVVTLLLMFSPAVATFVFTVSSPSLWPAEKPLARENLKFLAVQLWYFIGFPFAVIYRYCRQIFWSVEALAANLIQDVERREDALRQVLQPSPLEMYFFLQAYLHSGPQILLQFYTLLETTLYREAATIQILSITTSLMRMAMTTMSYQRFERRKVLGACYPWSSRQADQISKRHSQCAAARESAAMSARAGSFGDLRFSEECASANEDPVTPTEEQPETEYMEVFEDPRSTLLPEYTIVDPMSSETEYSGAWMNPERAKTARTSDPSESDESEFENDKVLELRKPARTGSNNKRKPTVSIVEDPETITRRESRIGEARRYNIVDMTEHITPPDTPAPRPTSMATFRDRMMSNAEALAEKIPRRRYKDALDFDVPIRVRRTAIKGIEQEDGVAKFIAFVAWLLFLAARMLALATFTHFHFAESFYVCIAHCAVMLAFLMWNSWSQSLHRKAFYFFLCYVYVFCLIEFKMTFRKVRLWYGLYFVIVTTENVILTGIWFFEKNWTGWWYGYMALLVLGTSFLSYSCFLIYVLILKPKAKIVYPIADSHYIPPETDC